MTLLWSYDWIREIVQHCSFRNKLYRSLLWFVYGAFCHFRAPVIMSKFYLFIYYWWTIPLKKILCVCPWPGGVKMKKLTELVLLTGKSWLYLCTVHSKGHRQICALGPEGQTFKRDFPSTFTVYLDLVIWWNKLLVNYG